MQQQKQSQGWSITHFCSACKDPKGSELGNKDNLLQIGDCAIDNSHGFKFGRTITIGGRNYRVRVVDHCGIKNTVDIYQGKKAKCSCNVKQTGLKLYWLE